MQPHTVQNGTVAEEIPVRAFFGRIRSCDRGATAVEYGLILALVVLAMIGALTNVATKTIAMWNHVSTEVTNH